MAQDPRQRLIEALPKARPGGSSPRSRTQGAPGAWSSRSRIRITPPLRAQAELHLHIEGTLEPAMMLDLSRRNGLAHTLPFTTLAEAQAAYNFKDLQARARRCPAARSSSSLHPQAIPGWLPMCWFRCARLVSACWLAPQEFLDLYYRGSAAALVTRQARPCWSWLCLVAAAETAVMAGHLDLWLLAAPAVTRSFLCQSAAPDAAV